MADNRSVAWSPEWGVAPGEILQEALEERDMTQAELARRMDRPAKTINEIIKGKASITADTAIQLERTLGIVASVWNGLESNYREHLARERAMIELEKDASWVDSFPVRDLVKNGLVRRHQAKAETLADLLSFFRVSNKEAWRRQWAEPVASFRASAAFRSSPEAVAAWLRWGEIQADEVDTSPFDEVLFEQALAEARTLTRREPISIVLDRIRDIFAAAGVALVLTPELSSTHLSGAARWIRPNKAIIQLSLRHKTDDQFWFTLFHEAAHVLQPGHDDFLDGPEDGEPLEDEKEIDANQFARAILLDLEEYSALSQSAVVDINKVRDFAANQGVAPGIVVGWLQRDGVIEYSQMNSLKKSMQWR